MRSMKPWKFFKGRARKKFLACLLSLSVIPMNGFTVMAATEPQDDQQPTTQVEEQVTTEEPNSTTNEEVKMTEKSKISKQETKSAAKSVEESNDGKVSFAAASTTVKIGHFQIFEFEGVDCRDIEDINFSYSDPSKLYMKEEHMHDEEDNCMEKYIPIARQKGTVKVSATLRMKDGTIKEVEETEFTVESADEGIVPITNYEVYRCLVNDNDLQQKNDGEISIDEMKNVSQIDMSFENVTDQDLEILKYAKNCKSIDLEETDVTDISFMENMTQLQKVILSYTNVEDISALSGAKDTLQQVSFPYQVSAEQRVKLLNSTNINIKYGRKKKNPIRPKGLFNNCNNINFVASDKKINVSYDSGENELILEAADGMTEGTTQLLITDAEGNKTFATIPVQITNDADNNDFGFAKDQESVNIGSFRKQVELKLKESDASNQYDLTITSDKPEIVDDYTDEENDTYYFEAHKEGSATFTVEYIDDEGNVYTDSMKVTVSGAENGIVPLKSYKMYSNVKKDGESVDVNGDGRISYQELQDANDIQWENCDLQDEDTAVLSNAVNCEILYLYGNADVKNIGFVSNMKKLKEFDIDYTDVKDISALKDKKDQLTRFYPSKHISFSERLEFIKDITYINIEDDDIDGIYDIIKPYGILAQLDDYKVTSSNSEIVEVWKNDEEGDYYVDVKKGQEGKVAILTITSGDISKTIKVVITGKDGNLPIENIMINKSSLSLNSGQSDQLSVSYLPDFAMNRTVTWTSSNNAVVSVDANGKVTANAAGTAVITATTANGKTAQCTVTVTNPPAPAPQTQVVKVNKISIKGISTKIAAGKKVKLAADIAPSNVTNKSVIWTTSNKKVATVNVSGVVSVNKKAGGKTVTITATAKDGSAKKATYKIKVMKGAVKKVKISGKKSVKAGKTLSLKAKVTASKGANKKLKWTSSNTKYATVSGSGKVKALKAGKKKSVKITAMATDGSGKKATVTIKIK